MTKLLPVPRWLRIVLLVVAIAVSVVVLFEYVFPWVKASWYDPSIAG